MKKLLLCCAISLVLAGCGDDKPAPGLPGLPGDLGNMPGPDAYKDMMQNPGTVKLTDDMMESFVALMAELKDVDTPGEALLARHGFDMPKWAMLSALIGSSNMRAEYAQRADEAKAKLAAATTDREKERWKQRLESLETARKASGGMFGEASEIDKQNHAVYLRWKDRIEAATR